MIKYKDEVFDEYSICPVTGDIFNAKTGETQNTYLNQGRPTFKGMPVHQIMAHTFFGYIPRYDVHHLDENKLNNSLSNLVYLTHAEHAKHHLSESNLGRHLSKETRAKLSAANKGENNPNYGKHHSEETKQKMRKPKSEETKQKMRKPKSEAQKANMREAWKRRKLKEELLCQN